MYRYEILEVLDGARKALGNATPEYVQDELRNHSAIALTKEGQISQYATSQAIGFVIEPLQNSNYLETAFIVRAYKVSE